MNTDHTLPEGPWQFDSDVTRVFDDMLERSIPQHDVMRRTVLDLASEFYVPETTWIHDLGTSRGGAIAGLVDRYGARGRFHGVEISDPMLEAARERFEPWIDLDYVRIEKMDLRTDYPETSPSVVLSVLTLMFIPSEYRAQIVDRIVDALRPGGAFILVEKTTQSHGRLDSVFVDLYYRSKRAQGYTEDEIERKRLSLEGVLVPWTATANEQLLEAAGLHVTRFWQWLNFAGWIGIRR